LAKQTQKNSKPVGRKKRLTFFFQATPFQAATGTTTSPKKQRQTVVSKQIFKDLGKFILAQA